MRAAGVRGGGSRGAQLMSSQPPGGVDVAAGMRAGQLQHRRVEIGAEAEAGRGRGATMGKGAGKDRRQQRVGIGARKGTAERGKGELAGMCRGRAGRKTGAAAGVAGVGKTTGVEAREVEGRVRAPPSAVAAAVMSDQIGVSAAAAGGGDAALRRIQGARYAVLYCITSELSFVSLCCLRAALL